MIAIRAAAASIVLLMLTVCVTAQDQAILGLWTTDQGKGRVDVTKCAAPNQGLCGTIVWISEPNDKQGKPHTDQNNKNASLRNRPIVGLQIFDGWREAGAGKWKGSVYDPEDGTSYDVDITLAGDKLTLKGCVLLLCELGHLGSLPRPLMQNRPACPFTRPPPPREIS